MSKNKEKSTEANNSEKINEMILKFRQCADAASQLSDSVERFTDIYSSIENNVTKLNSIERNLSSNNYIKDLLNATSSMKDIFNYFNSSIPELSKYIQSSKNELNSYKDEFQFIDHYFRDFPKQMDNEMVKIKSVLDDNTNFNKNMINKIEEYIEAKSKKIENLHTRTKKKTLEDIKKYFDTEIRNSQQETVKLINESVDRIITEKFQRMFSEFDNITNNFIESVNRNYYQSEQDTIYNLYVNNYRQLPIYVRRTTWSSNFYFKVEKIENYSNEQLLLVASGIRYKGDSYYDTFQISADLKQFRPHFFDRIDITPVDDGDIPF